MLKRTKKIIWIFIKAFTSILKTFFVLITVFLIFVALFKKDWIENFVEWMKIQVENLWSYNYLIACISCWIEAIPILWTTLPWQNILLLVWWFFWSISINNFFILILSASLWWILWNFIWFYLWKFYWEHFFDKYWIWFWIWKTEVKYLKKWIKKWWPSWIIFWKFHPITRSFLPFIAWSMKMNAWIFMLYNTIWSILYSVVIIWIWILFVENYKVIIDYIWYIMLWIAIIVFLYIYFFKKDLFDEFMKEKRLELKELDSNLKEKFKK